MDFVPHALSTAWLMIFHGDDVRPGNAKILLMRDNAEIRLFVRRVYPHYTTYYNLFFGDDECPGNAKILLRE